MNTSSSGRNRITFGETPASFRFEADVTFLAANDSSRYINFTFDYVGEADTGSAQGFRVTTAAANGLESCHGTRGSFTCATKAAPVSLGVGAQHHLALQIVDDEAEVRIDGSVVATPAISGCHSGQLGFLLDGATVAFDNVVVTAISQPLSSPRNLKTAAVADTITATWDEPASLGDDATGQPATLDHYEIAVKPSSELPAAADFTSTTERSFTVSGLAVGTYVASVRAVNSAGAASRIAITTATLSPRIAFGLPLTQRPGDWNSGHVQGMAVDINGGYLYYSFTSVFVKTDFQGRVIGTVTNYGPGALSDIVFG